MRIQLLFFAQAAQWMRTRVLTLEANGSKTLGELLEGERQRLAPVLDHRQGMRIAVNGAFADLDTPLHEGDDIAFLPPVSGG